MLVSIHIFIYTNVDGGTLINAQGVLVHFGKKSTTSCVRGWGGWGWVGGGWEGNNVLDVCGLDATLSTCPS